MCNIDVLDKTGIFTDVNKEGKQMIDVYENCPTFENEKYFLRMVTDEDVDDLLKVYSDIQAVPLFNSDNCHGDDFHYETIERMKQAMDFWSFSYKNRYFVRWAIIEKSVQKAVGTIELFNRTSEDYFSNCGILRLDLSSVYENAAEIKSILSLITEPAYDLFDCNLIATKAIKAAKERRSALVEAGFVESSEKLVGHDGTEYDSYFARSRVMTV